MKKVIFLIMVGWFSLILIGCSPVSSQGQPDKQNQIVYTKSDQTIGQTFTSRQDGLTGLRLFLSSDEVKEVQVFLAIYDSPSKVIEYVKTEKNVLLSPAGELIDFVFSPPLNSYLSDYYFELTVKNKATVIFGSSHLSSYEDGSAYLNDQAIDAQLFFVPLHDPALIFRGLLKQGFEWFLWVLVAIFLFVLPGFAISDLLLQKQWKEIWQLKLAFSLSVGISIYPLLLLIEDMLGLKLGRINAFMLGGASSLYLISLWWKNGKKLNLDLIKSPSITSIAAIWILMVIFFTRFWAIRTLPLPMWGDSVHHTLIAQLITENGGLFNSWQPYTEMKSLTYHFGFHANVATISWLTGMNASQATLVGGQLINVFAVIVLFPLAWKLSRSNVWGGVIAWLVAGLLSFMPMFYVNWGRYTQLSGQVLLPIIIFLLWELVEEGRWNWRKSLMIGFLMASLAVTHYRVFIFMIAGIPPLFLYLRRQNLSNLIKNSIVIGISGALLFIPWGVRLIGGQLSNNLVRQVTTPPAALGDFAKEYNQIGDLTNYLPAWLWLITIVVILFGIWRHDKRIIFVLGWWLFILFLANPSWINLPGSGVLSNFAVFIAMYIPAGIFIGAGFIWLFEEKRLREWFRYSQLIVLIVILILTFPLMRDRIRDVHPDQYALATRADIRAAEWIKENLPQESKILVNSFFAYGGTVIVGSDGGWWIPALTERKINLPPMPYTTERGPIADYAQYVNELRWLIEEKGYTSPEVIDELQRRGIEYAYIGQKRGRVNYAGPVVMNADEMIASGLYEPVYHQDGVWVLKIKFFDT